MTVFLPFLFISFLLLAVTDKIMEHTSAPFIAIVSILLPSGYCEQNLCPAGTYMKSSSNSIEPCCIPCPNGTFQTTANSAGSCATCSVACTMPREIEVAPCTSIADIECQCQNGTHRDKTPHGGCLHHKPCNAGSGVIAAGLYTHLFCKVFYILQGALRNDPKTPCDS